LAAAVRVTDSPVLLTGLGAFGQHVVRLLLAGGGRGCRSIAPGELDRAFRSAADAIVVAMWRPERRLCDQADYLSFLNGRPWLPIVAEHPHLLVGPWVAPGGPCYRCYRRRRDQHDAQHELTAALHAAFDEHPTLGPVGYLPHHARIAAGLAAMVLRRGLPVLEPGDPSVLGEVSTVNVLTGATATHHVIPCHRCARCRPEDRVGTPGAGLAALITRLSPHGGRDLSDGRRL
jgi:bacteriocin biosynthesis cyclodehydratase domain-containing protein